MPIRFPTPSRTSRLRDVLFWLTAVAALDVLVVAFYLVVVLALSSSDLHICGTTIAHDTLIALELVALVSLLHYLVCLVQWHLLQAGIWRPSLLCNPVGWIHALLSGAWIALAGLAPVSLLFSALPIFCNLSLVGVVLVRTLGHTNTIAPGPGSNSIPDPESTPGPLDLEKVPPPILPVWPRDERRMQTLESRISDFCDVSAVAGDESAAVEMVVLDDDTVYAVSVASMSVNGGSRWRDSCMSCAETLVSPVSPVVPAMPPAYRSLMGGAGGRAYSAV